MTAVSTPANSPLHARRRLRLPRSILAFPAWFWFLAFFAAPLGLVVFNSFGSKVPQSVGNVSMASPSLGRYREALTGTFFSVFETTLKIAVLGTVLCLVIGFPVAYWLATRASARLKGVMLGLVIIPFWTNFLIRTLSWTIVLSPEGYLSHQLQSWGILGGPIHLLATKTAVQIGVVYNYLPLMIFPLFVALDRLDPSLREASKDLGATPGRTFLQVTGPLAMPGIIAGLLLVYIPLAGDYLTAKILGKAQGNMAGAFIASQVIDAQNLPAGAAMAVILILLILGTILAVGGIGLAIAKMAQIRRSVYVETGDSI